MKRKKGEREGPPSPRIKKPPEPPISYSSLAAFLACRERYRLRMLGWKPQRPAMAQVVGSLIHGTLEMVGRETSNADVEKLAVDMGRYLAANEFQARNISDPVVLGDFERWVAVTAMLAQEYRDYWNRTENLEWAWPLPEIKVEAVLPGVRPKMRIMGKLDGSIGRVRRAGSLDRFILERKTTSWIQQEQVLFIPQLSLQSRFYLALALLGDPDGLENPAGIVYEIIRKPANKPKENEGPTAFAERVRESVRKDPSYYFLRVIRTASAPEVQQILEQQIIPACRDLRKYRQGRLAHYRNSDPAICFGRHACPFVEACMADGPENRPDLYLTEKREDDENGRD